MVWPTAQEYSEAIQNPQVNFIDAELKAGQVELTPLGLPRPISGNFATVFRMQCGQHDWAVRCFMRNVTDQQQRYAAISEYFARIKHLARIQLPYIVDFKFIETGIKVSGQWYPILKMAWVTGDLLDKFITKHLHNSAILQDLATRWVTMMQTLDKAGIAHGDLQHGNILVVNGELRLIDYDGLFVGTLAGFSSNEVGHPNYQHPSRTGNDFRADLDRFSAWVIYIALVSLSIDPQLRQRIGSGDEFLLLRKEDFQNPETSSALALLLKHQDASIQSLVTEFKQLLSNPSQIPPLDNQRIIFPATSRPVLSASAAASTAATFSDWLADHLPQPSSPSLPSPPISVKPASDNVKPQKKLLSPVVNKRLVSKSIVGLFCSLMIFLPSLPPTELPPLAKSAPIGLLAEESILPEHQITLLAVRSNVENNTVFINDKNYGSTPLNLELPLDLYTVRVEKEGYLPSEKQIDLQEAETLSFTLQPQLVQLMVRSNIEDSLVFINEKHCGSTPAAVEMPLGLYTVRVEKDGYLPYEEQVTLQQAVTLQAHLRKNLLSDRLHDGSFGPEMVSIPAGRFQIGDIQRRGESDERPVYWVLVKNFAIGRYEVTFAEYDRFAKATGRKKPSDRGWGRDKRPVIGVSWDDATAYAKWLSQQTGQHYRLPTEVEWEYAASAGTETARYWGNGSKEAHRYANVADKTAKKKYSSWTRIHHYADGYVHTAPVGSFQPNAFGLFDILGNVWEWTCSEYERKYRGKEKQCADNNRTRLRVIRGGAWNSNPGDARTANRYRFPHDFRSGGVGFRVARQ
ncbi:MAG: hypothetical protein DRR19_08745 [Candidatus Parabeggiatoa sp. nov. 1]|nr:MAG: hypothetical protein DRR19_08745 [Gammaproteobacteria bacterium]